jgi:hypothetical protein
MKSKSNIQELIDKFKTLSEQAAEIDFSAALLLGAKASMAQMNYRIFNTGKDMDGRPFGEYTGRKFKTSSRRFGYLDEDPLDKSVKKKLDAQKKRYEKNASDTGREDFTEYEKKRLTAGRQIQYKDLEFTGDLRRSIDVVKVSNTAVEVVFKDEENANKAEYQEVQVGEIRGGGKAPIFGQSDSEKELMDENIFEGLNQIYDSIFGNNPGFQLSTGSRSSE